MEHYFINKEHKESDYFKFETKFLDKNYIFNSCSDIFSKNELDYGSLVLVKTVLKHFPDFEGNVLDMCAGYGTIGILLSKNLPNTKFSLAEINKTGIELSKKNVKENKCLNIENIVESNLFENITEKFDMIVSNPPIKVGKQILFKFATDSYEFLNNGGNLVLVIKKNLGADSLKKHLISIYGNCEILNRDKGYYILKSTK